MTPVASLFTADSLSDLSAPSPGSADTIHVTDSYTVDADTTLDLAGNLGFKLDVGRNPVSLDIAGTVTLDSNHHKLFGVVTNQSDNGHASVTIDATGSLSVSTDASGAVAVGIYILSSGASVTNAGMLHVSAPQGVAEGISVTTFESTVANTGAIEVDALGIGYGIAASLRGDGNFTNGGTITVTAGQAQGLSYDVAGAATVLNSGEIDATSTNAVSGFAVGILAENVGGSTADTLTNSGDVLASGGAEAFGVDLLDVTIFHNTGRIIAEGGSAFTAGVTFTSAGGGGTIINDGLIRATDALLARDAAPFGAPASNDSVINNGKLLGAVELGGGADNLNNDGRIAGMVDLGSGNDNLNNDGRIAGAVDLGSGDDNLNTDGKITGAIDLGGGNDNLSNAGQIVGAIDLRSGDDNLSNGGQIVGAVDLGSGDDNLSNSGRLVGAVELGDGADLFNSSHGRIDGMVSGGLGDDTLIGSSGGDTLYGDQQDNSLGGGEDIIRGMKGDDHLIGGVGNDTLTGGAGADTLKGGDGADTFKFDRASDFAGSKIDVIVDLTNSDTISLRGIDADTTTGGDQAFHLVASFTGAAGELTVSYNAGIGLTTIAGDTNGDGVADLDITVSGDHHDFTNFVL